MEQKEKILQTRLIQRHDITQNWNKAINFIPKQGEIIVYDDNDLRIKIGDGQTAITNLPFLVESSLSQRHDTTENWQKMNDFVPSEGEIIIYDDNEFSIKIGDGTTKVNDLPFLLDVVNGKNLVWQPW